MSAAGRMAQGAEPMGRPWRARAWACVRGRVCVRVCACIVIVAIVVVGIVVIVVVVAKKKRDDSY